MLMFALESGIAVPRDLLASLERAFCCGPVGPRVAAAGQTPLPPGSPAERSEIAAVPGDRTEGAAMPLLTDGPFATDLFAGRCASRAR